MGRRPRFVAVVALGIAAVAVFAAAVFGAGSLSDPVADNGTAPDIVSVMVSEKPQSTLAVEVAIANYEALPQNSWITMRFDLDSNPRTGADGDEALVRYADGVLELYRSSGGELGRRPATDMSATFTDGVLRFAGPRSAFDGRSTFALLVVASRGQLDLDGEELISSDYAPSRGRAAIVLPGPASVVDAADDHGAAPDLTAVEVSDTAGGTVAFDISTSNFPGLPQDRTVVLAVDRDRRRSTGAIGADLLVAFSPGRPLAVGRWSAAGDEFVELDRPRARGRYADGILAIRLNRSVLQDVARFSYVVEAYDVVGANEVDQGDEGAVTAYDYSPDANGSELVYRRYTLVNTPPLRLVAGVPVAMPARPVAGTRLTVSIAVERSHTARPIASGSASCAVKVGGRLVETTAGVAAGRALCVVTVPSCASGKVIAGTMTVRSSGLSVTAPFAFRVI